MLDDGMGFSLARIIHERSALSAFGQNGLLKTAGWASD